ncbi:MAG TPA: YdeI/OmpD-associated family protein [Gammaproteobacteria bacterium]|nr:YdeI/OmpD-associated family protein [Gammaproteobacteria bacterium]
MKKYRFDAEIKEGRGGGAYVVFPYDVEKEFGTSGKVPVDATIDGEPEKSSLMRMGMPQHILGVAKAIREKIGKKPGNVVTIVLWKDDAPREVAVPPELQARMKKAGVLAFFESLSFTHRKEYCRWITEAKKEETRARRLARAIELLTDGVRTPG